MDCWFTVKIVSVDIVFCLTITIRIWRFKVNWSCRGFFRDFRVDFLSKQLKEIWDMTNWNLSLYIFELYQILVHRTVVTRSLPKGLMANLLCPLKTSKLLTLETTTTAVCLQNVLTSSRNIDVRSLHYFLVNFRFVNLLVFFFNEKAENDLGLMTDKDVFCHEPFLLSWVGCKCNEIVGNRFWFCWMVYHCSEKNSWLSQLAWYGSSCWRSEVTAFPTQNGWKTEVGTPNQL